MADLPEMSEQERAALLMELAQAGVKHTPEKIVAIAKTRSGKVIFLETGNADAGLAHILGKEKAFRGIGVAREQIQALIMKAAVEETVVGIQNDRPVFYTEFDGQERFLAITVSENGFIVGANPKSSKAFFKPSKDQDDAPD